MHIYIRGTKAKSCAKDINTKIQGNKVNIKYLEDSKLIHTSNTAAAIYDEDKGT